MATVPTIRTMPVPNITSMAISSSRARVKAPSRVSNTARTARWDRRRRLRADRSRGRGMTPAANPARTIKGPVSHGRLGLSGVTNSTRTKVPRTRASTPIWNTSVRSRRPNLTLPSPIGATRVDHRARSLSTVRWTSARPRMRSSTKVVMARAPGVTLSLMSVGPSASPGTRAIRTKRVRLDRIMKTKIPNITMCRRYVAANLRMARVAARL
jgi:hypothetical protein